MSAASKHEVLASAAVKRFLALIENAPKCKEGRNCPLRRYLLTELHRRDKKGNFLLAELFDQTLDQ